MVGRPRTIDREAVLDAAQAVAARDGAAYLTLEAVATEAGISKASVLYDYKNKQALMKAVIERRIAAEDARIQDIRKCLGEKPNAAILARLIAESRELSDDDRAVALSLCASVAGDAELREPVRAMMAQRVASVRDTSEDESGAMLAFLAIEGLKALEWLSLYEWPPAERSKLISEIRWLIDQKPEEIPCEEISEDS
ncbi:TetR/AcrR family transcriptional regulator [Nisaea acidiphila]|uniref:TetR/AcrR family transcriptional regulator n=1 Tax=Nisaea acidiphila TaxID=1862145 RepID=A0A9J7ATT1_9PROT|nr:TetR/AcrR family transcriptional regulator [Nisaea acidiphila]UUX50719.1 TetR/AcrR family transcriptional regulator [Nisaea acidiphila]